MAPFISRTVLPSQTDSIPTDTLTRHFLPPQPLAASIPLPVSISSTIPGTSCKWNHNFCPCAHQNFKAGKDSFRKINNCKILKQKLKHNILCLNSSVVTQRNMNKIWVPHTVACMILHNSAPAVSPSHLHQSPLQVLWFFPHYSYTPDSFLLI